MSVGRSCRENGYSQQSKKGGDQKMKLVIEIECGNSAFEDSYDMELVRILGTIQEGLLHGQSEGLCRDYNGNKVGDFKLVEGEK